MDLYFEYPDYLVDGTIIPAKYCVKYDCEVRDVTGSRVITSTTAPHKPSAVSFTLMYAASRIWCDDPAGLIPIKFIKNRNSRAETTPVDMKEFLWVKLSAREIR